MSIDNIIPDNGEEIVLNESMTVGELVNKYGEEAVRRGISYMHSLAEAEKEYKKSATSEQMREGYEKAGLDPEHEETEKASGAWAESMNENGLGINDDDSE